MLDPTRRGSGRCCRIHHVLFRGSGLVVGERDGALFYFERLADGSLVPRTGADNPFDGIDVGDYSAPAFVDWDADGDVDLVSPHGPVDFAPTTGGLL